MEYSSKKLLLKLDPMQLLLPLFQDYKIFWLFIFVINLFLNHLTADNKSHLIDGGEWIW